MIAARRPFNGTFILLLGIHQKFTDSGVKQAIAFPFYIKSLKDCSNIRYSFFIYMDSVCSKKAIPGKFIRIPVSIDRMTIGIIALNFIPLHMAIYPGFYTYVIMQSKTVVNAYAPNAVCGMGLRQTPGSSNIPLIFFNDMNPFKTDIKGMNRNDKLSRNTVVRITIPGESHICRRNALDQASQRFMFRSKLFGKNHVKFDRAGKGCSLFGFYFNNYFPSGLPDLFFTYARIDLKCYRLVIIGNFIQSFFKQLFAFKHFPLDLILRLQQSRLFAVQGNGNSLANADFSALSVFLFLFFCCVFVTGQFGGTILRFRYQLHDIGKFLIVGMKKGKR